jgi:hypothetical protein
MSQIRVPIGREARSLAPPGRRVVSTPLRPEAAAAPFARAAAVSARVRVDQRRAPRARGLAPRPPPRGGPSLVGGPVALVRRATHLSGQSA